MRVLEPQPARYGEPSSPLHAKLEEKLSQSGIERLFLHQSKSIDAARQGKDVMIVTGTGSGKTLCYNLPVLDTCLREPSAKAIYLFPTKALAQDQAGKLKSLLPEGILAGVYDGDTSSASRSAIRRNANIVLTNPDMLHVGILPHQENWYKFFKNLRYVVVDEAHTYRGVFGSHMAGVLRRLLRLCAWQNNRPQVIACSATVANPLEHFVNLTGRQGTLIDDDAGPKSQRTIVLVAPPEGADGFSTNPDTANLLAEFSMHGLRTLAFCRSRETTELVLRQAREALEKHQGDPEWVDSYRGGYTPKERREIEHALFTGRLRGLATTNAMELGVDVGGLDAVVLNSYPGTVSSFWQQTGRAGRGARNGFALMLAGDEPLEQYLVREPELLLDKPVEGCTTNLANPHILEAQLRCAAHERPIDEEELETFLPSHAKEAANRMVESGAAVWQAGRLFYPSYESPAGKVNIRGIGQDTVLLMAQGQPVGEMEYWRALTHAYVGATYMHRGRTFVVESLDLVRKLATMSEYEPPYYTVAEQQTIVESTVSLETNTPLTLCGVRVTSVVTGYTKIARRGGNRIGDEPLDLPPYIFDSVGVRIDLPELTIEEAGTCHAVEHALYVAAPLIAGCDQRDLSRCWYSMSPETMSAALYVYDQVPGGIGLAERWFRERELWFNQALSLLESCPCDDGCPACLWLSTCANVMVDKRGAMDWLNRAIISAGWTRSTT